MGPRLALLLVLALTTACGSETSGGGRAGIEGDWRLVSADAVADPDRYPVTLSVEDGRISGRAACNHYDGTARIDGDRIELSALSMTEIGCEEPAITAEQAFMQALGDVDRFRTAAGRLILTGSAGELRFERVEPVPNAALAGTDWMLDTLLVDQTAMSTTGTATLRLSPDGAITGSTGCRDFTGSYVIGGEQIRTTRLAPAEKACPPDVKEQDEIVLNVLDDSFMTEIEGDRLTLTAGRKGLVYRLRRRD